MEPFARSQPNAAQTRLEARLDRLGSEIERLRVDFERFFNGALAVPPEDLREQIRDELRQLRALNLRAAADNFRLNGLEARFNAYNEMLNRRLRDHEEGRRVTTSPPPPPTSRHDVERGVVVGARLDDDAVEALYAGLARGGRAPRFDLESFRSFLADKMNAIRDTTGCSHVQFRLAEEDGKPKLKARPVRKKSG